MFVVRSLWISPYVYGLYLLDLPDDRTQLLLYIACLRGLLIVQRKSGCRRMSMVWNWGLQFRVATGVWCWGFLHIGCHHAVDLEAFGVEGVDRISSDSPRSVWEAVRAA